MVVALSDLSFEHAWQMEFEYVEYVFYVWGYVVYGYISLGNRGVVL